MSGHIEFVYNEKDDIIVARPVWKVETEQDCRVWNDEWVSYLSKFKQKMDVIILLDEFSVSSEVAGLWGELRADINKDYIRFGYRVNPELAVSLFVKTSGTRYHAATAEAASVEDAVKAIFAERNKLR